MGNVDVSVEIYDPKNKLVYEIIEKDSGEYEEESIHEKGDYQICFDNT